MPNTNVNTNPSNPTPIQPASFSKRILAMIYDGILVVALLMIASAIALFMNNNEPINSGNPLMIIWLLLVGFLYYGVSWKVSGQTLGLRTWQLRLVMDDNQPLSWSTVVLRYFLALLLFFTIIGFVWMLFNKQKSTLYDTLSHTKVIDEKKSGINPNLH